ncbi:MAG: ABC transporter ATP-binding protein [Albidovulum sp.]|uniref:ABC transporter ATP-binding protein n=1 Tax=Albidovulum sp. TaxID=1872424 RepID=UPI001320751B|nr:ABC transporter ATP-binding protein [Defluviimonas sp.]KAB2885758.1 MAG: ABC transporter ATP-binding protein [Defluviimonas sp.]
MTPAFLSIRSLRQTYGSVVAVDDVSLEIPEGEFLTFLGPSGSGKSTTLYALAGFNEPTSGDILLRGGSILATPSHKRNIGMVFQRYTLFPHLNVRENVGFPLRVRGRPEREVARRVDTMLALVRLDGYGDRMPGHLSGGQQQRVALARALAYDPPVLLMDEPLSALDKKLREEIQIEIRRIHRETGVTILYVTHDQEEALRLSDRIAVFNRGRIEQVGSGRDLYHNPATRFVASFIGHPPMSLITAMGDGTWLRLGDGTPLAASTHKGAVLAGARPEAVVLDAGGASFVPLHREDLGSHVVQFFRLPDGQTVAVQSPAGRPVPADAGLGIPEHALHLFDAEAGARLVS